MDDWISSWAFWTEMGEPRVNIIVDFIGGKEQPPDEALIIREGNNYGDYDSRIYIYPAGLSIKVFYNSLLISIRCSIGQSIRLTTPPVLVASRIKVPGHSRKFTQSLIAQSG